MIIKNDMESVVRDELARQAAALKRPKWLSLPPVELALRYLSDASGSNKRSRCECLLCNTDTIAFSLTNLPPCYCRSLHYGISSEKVDSGNISRNLEESVRRVTLRPRHPERHFRNSDEGVSLIDFGLQEGKRVVPFVMKKLSTACRCSDCLEDTLAFGLNQMKPKYGVRIEGTLRMPATEIEFYRHEMIPVMVEAARKISLNPRHDG